MSTEEIKDDVSVAAESELWLRWLTQQDQAARDALATHHLSFARTMAAIAFSKRTHDDAEFDDYFQFASLGLLQSIDRFNPRLGIKFRTFASKRVTGAIVDGIARISEKSEQISAYHRINRERLAQIKSEAELATMENFRAQCIGPNSEDRLFSYLGEVGLGMAIGILLEGSGMVDNDVYETCLAEQSPAAAYYDQQNLRDIRRAMQNSLKNLSCSEARVIHLHYLQEVPFEDVAILMDLSRARISQLHKEALKKLRELMRGNCYSDIFG